MRASVIVVGEFPGALLTRMLKFRRFDRQVNVHASLNVSSAESLGSSYLAIEYRPVALILDAHQTNPVAVEHEQKMSEGMLRMVTPHFDFEVIMMAPEVEVVLFQVPGLLEELGFPALTPAQKRKARRAPKRLLQELMAQVPKGSRLQRPPGTSAQLVRLLTRAHLEALWELPPFVRLARLLERVCAPHYTPPQPSM